MNRVDEKNFVITGANFSNKGAQAMLFTTVYELKTRFPNSEIFVDTREEINNSFKFEHGYINWEYMYFNKITIKYLIKSVIKYFIGKKNDLRSIFISKKILNSCDAIFDISGFSLSSQWGYTSTKSFIHKIAVAKKFGIRIFLMPQSFGPLNYGEKQKEIDNLIAEYLSYPSLIFSREKNGYEILKEKYGLTNVRSSHDMVLQNKNIDYSVISDKLNICIPQLSFSDNVAIIPNMRNCDHGKETSILEIYSAIIHKLIESGKNVYILRHSLEDRAACKKIYDYIPEKERLFLLDDDFNCIQFNELVKHFDFVIGSRYHSIVHSYKNGVPAIVLGWAEKYHDLMELFNQEVYMFDVREEIDLTKMMSSIGIMLENYEKEKQTILNYLPKYQSFNCFDSINCLIN